MDDKFEKQERNSDYQDTTDEFFSEDHIYYSEEGFEGFADYSIVGDEFSEKGFAPYAVAIHVVYFADDMTLRIKHFVSDSNEDPRNPALKFYEAVSKLTNWYRSEKPNVHLTLGLKTFMEHYDNQTYPGLGTVKKLSLMHHIELLSKYLPEQLSSEELESIVENVFNEVNPTSVKDMGAIMKVITPLVKGKADMREVNAIIKEKLNNL